MTGLRVLAFTTLGAMIACSSFSSADDGAPTDAGAETATDALAEDGGTTNETGPADAEPDGPTSLLSNSDFELGCAGWRGGLGDLTEITDPSTVHRGRKACRVCGTAGLAPYFLYASVKVNAPPGAQYYGNAYVRAAPGKTPPPNISVRIDVLGADGGVVQAGGDTTSPKIDDTWQSTSALTDLSTADDGAVQLTFRSAAANTCFIVDDVLLYRSK